MSKCINYEKVAEDYDSSRYAMGVETMTLILSGLLKKNPEEISMLEAGCGTGNYSLGFLQNGIGNLTILDASEAMLERARNKISKYSSKVKEIKRHELPSIPYPDESFDVVTFMQVLQHLDTHHLKSNGSKSKVTESYDNHRNDFLDTIRQNYPNLSLSIKEAYRVLKPQGVLMIDHRCHTNLDASWLSLAPKAQALYKEANLSGVHLLDIMKDANFKDLFRVSRPGVELSKLDVYNNPEMILDAQFRNTQSEWAFVEKTGELPEVLNLIKKHKDEGTLRQFAFEHNELFRLIGETTSIYARKN